jgi:biotin transport system substrate-specific component
MASVARPLTLADVAVPRSNVITDTLLVIAASLVTAAAAQIEIRLPWTPVPITGQTFAVLLSGTLLGARRAFLGQCLYLLEGAMGLPFFAGGAAGVRGSWGPRAAT